jgi:hypothetical protein
VIQDTTFVNYNTQTKKKGLGKMTNNPRGVKIHTAIAVTPDGLNLGVLNQIAINSDSSQNATLSDYEKKDRPMEEKESYRWIESYQHSNYMLPADADISFISDREGDIYAYMNAVNSGKRFFLTRIAQNRITTDNQRVLTAIQNEFKEGEIVVKIPRNTSKNIKSREATLEIRFSRYDIKRPESLKKYNNIPESLSVYVIHTKEANPPSGIEPIEWFLMTNRPIENLATAVIQLQNYMQRWKIERFHYVLKTGGCDIEKIQARSMSVTNTMIMLYSIISVFIMNMTYAARLSPDIPCSQFFDEDEWKLLYCMANKTGKAPDKPYSIREAIKYITTLSSGYRPPSDGDPGVKLIWEGLEKFFYVIQHREAIALYAKEN